MSFYKTVRQMLSRQTGRYKAYLILYFVVVSPFLEHVREENGDFLTCLLGCDSSFIPLETIDEFFIIVSMSKHKLAVLKGKT